MEQNHLAVIDFGSQYTQLIVRRIRELGFFSRLYQPRELKHMGSPAAVILSGGPRSVTEVDAPDEEKESKDGSSANDIPVNFKRPRRPAPPACPP